MLNDVIITDKLWYFDLHQLTTVFHWENRLANKVSAAQNSRKQAQHFFGKKRDLQRLTTISHFLSKASCHIVLKNQYKKSHFNKVREKHVARKMRLFLVFFK